MPSMRATIIGLSAIFFVGLFLSPGEALAWGPGAHMVTGNWILQNLAMLPANVALVLMQHPGQFLHGVLSADIFIGKGSKVIEGHSHNWSSALSLLESAMTFEHKAYAYGYLCHLAADTVAHNVFVPGLFHSAPGNGRFAHVYLEAQADRILEWDVKDALSVFRETTSPEAARLLRSTMRQKTVSFWFKSRIFQKSIALGGSTLWKKSMCMVDALTPVNKRESLLSFMLILSTKAMASVLSDVAKSPILRLDPIGEQALESASDKRPRRIAASRLLRSRLMGKGRHFPNAACPRLRVSVPPELLNLPSLCDDHALCKLKEKPHDD